jgi:hypothetical protein
LIEVAAVLTNALPTPVWQSLASLQIEQVQHSRFLPCDEPFDPRFELPDESRNHAADSVLKLSDSFGGVQENLQREAVNVSLKQSMHLSVQAADFFCQISVQTLAVDQNGALFTGHSTFPITETSQDQLAEISYS